MALRSRHRRSKAKGQGVSSKIPRPVLPYEEDDLVGIIAETGGPLVRMVLGTGPEIKCPACERWAPFMKYKTFQQSPKYERYILPIYRCFRQDCRHAFALNPYPEE